jgi:hypothetical protein
MFVLFCWDYCRVPLPQNRIARFLARQQTNPATKFLSVNSFCPRTSAIKWNSTDFIVIALNSIHLVFFKVAPLVGIRLLRLSKFTGQAQPNVMYQCLMDGLKLILTKMPLAIVSLIMILLTNGLFHAELINELNFLAL